MDPGDRTLENQGDEERNRRTWDNANTQTRNITNESSTSESGPSAPRTRQQTRNSNTSRSRSSSLPAITRRPRQHPEDRRERSHSPIGRSLAPAVTGNSTRRTTHEMTFYIMEEGGNPNQETCSICLNKFEKCQGMVRLPCNHEFHARCMLRWMDENDTCPLRRDNTFHEYLEFVNV